MPLACSARGVRLWWCELRASPSQLRYCDSVLSPGECARAANYGLETLRNRYVIGRALLRLVLGRSLGLPPAEVPIIRGERGRPQLAGDATLDFNVSHTGEVALVGTLSDARVGVDVERIDRRINTAGIASKFLTDNERAAIAPLDAESARRAVLTLWTCKEAMSKATGDALSAPFASLDVDLRGGRTLRHGAGAYRPEQWSLHAAAVPDDYIATIAIWRPL
ncbi:MAG TPA: 4'-phosphopantetheinyl transferase superfamily protein [Casimicrobiaceae bacterium]|nr:4'-phosphopantetheinyl transferase superfamily protein [Casimicrobiaceae bacterium]